ncbi:hypothetical protein TIFTF001_025155 [Ficus carica]|uniref:Uncharacterized protein n=1 Tax=Ficus carica TaxID=3494 RepID=A0AA88DFC7_FICCA|nr:hypothetical protein TIFTF001_025155 [Ficus carica]
MQIATNDFGVQITTQLWRSNHNRQTAVLFRHQQHSQVSSIGSLEASWPSLVEPPKHNDAYHNGMEGRSIVASGHKTRVEATTYAEGLVAGLGISLSPYLTSSIASYGKDSGQRSWILQWRLKTQTGTAERREEKEGRRETPMPNLLYGH